MLERAFPDDDICGIAKASRWVLILRFLRLQTLHRRPSLHDARNGLHHAEKDRHDEDQHGNPKGEPLCLLPVVPPQLRDVPRLRIVKGPLQQHQPVSPVDEFLNLPLGAVESMTDARLCIDQVLRPLLPEPRVRLAQYRRDDQGYRADCLVHEKLGQQTGWRHLVQMQNGNLVEEHELGVVVLEEKVVCKIARPFHFDPADLFQMGSREDLRQFDRVGRVVEVGEASGNGPLGEVLVILPELWLVIRDISWINSNGQHQP